MKIILRPCAILWQVTNFLSLVVENQMYVHLKPKQLENLEDMAREADLFVEAHWGVFSCENKRPRDTKCETRINQRKQTSVNQSEGRKLNLGFCMQ